MPLVSVIVALVNFISTLDPPHCTHWVCANEERSENYKTVVSFMFEKIFGVMNEQLKSIRLRSLLKFKVAVTI